MYGTEAGTSLGGGNSIAAVGSAAGNKSGPRGNAAAAIADGGGRYVTKGLEHEKQGSKPNPYRKRFAVNKRGRRKSPIL